MTGFVTALALWSLLGANAPRENRRGLEALAKGDTAKALKHLEKAAKADTSDARYAYNLGTVQARTGKGSPDGALGQALSHAKSPQDRARILYNRGTARYETAKAKHQAATNAPPAPAQPGAQAQEPDNGENDVNGAIDDLRQTLKLRPGWNEAARNLDLALRLRSQCKKPKNDDKNKDQNKQDQQQQQPNPQQQLQQQDAQRLLEAAQAQENSQAKKAAPKKKDDDDGPDW
jgi:hypothetical protein